MAKNYLKISDHRKLARKKPIDDCMDVDIVYEEIEICSATPLVPFVEVAGFYDEDDVDE